MFNWFNRKAEDFFSPVEKEKVVAAIKAAELQTSGEVRVFIESKCRFVDPLDRAKELFEQLEMYKTEQRNAVLVYVAMKHRQLAVFGDEGIFNKTGNLFWNLQVKTMIGYFNKNDYAEGIAEIVLKIGEALHLYFPYNKTSDVNELPDNIVFGK